MEWIAEFCTMIAQLTGKIVARGTTEIVIDCNGVGYLVGVPLSTLDSVPNVGESVTVLTILVVREDLMQLFGFATETERDTFRLLTSIQGIGGRIALGILSASGVADLFTAIASGDVAALTRLPGIGKKTAERIVVELRDKIDSGFQSVSQLHSNGNEFVSDAITALQALGYSKASAEKSIATVLKTHPTLKESREELIRAALKLS